MISHLSILLLKHQDDLTPQSALTRILTSKGSFSHNIHVRWSSHRTRFPASVASTSNAHTSRARMRRNSAQARFLPMHWRGPTLKGCDTEGLYGMALIGEKRRSWVFRAFVKPALWVEGERIMERHRREGEGPRMHRDGSPARHPLAANSVAALRDDAR